MRTALRLAALTLAATLSFAARADDAVTDALQAAYAPYRAALFRTNGKSQPDAQQAMSQAQAAWKGLSERFASQPPAPYDRDRAFGSTLAQVAQVYDKAAAEIAAGKLPEAHETLEQARDLMAALRQRNGVVVFSDHMNAYHEQMEHVLTAGPGLLGGGGTNGTSSTSGGLTALALEVGALQHLAGRLSSQADTSLRANPEFNTLLKAVQQSVADLRAAVLAQDAAAAKAALGKLKGPYSRLFLKFG